MKVSGIISFVFMLIGGLLIIFLSFGMLSVLNSGNLYIKTGIIELILGIALFISALKESPKSNRLFSIFTLMSSIFLFVIFIVIAGDDAVLHKTLYKDSAWIEPIYAINILMMAILSIVNLIITFTNKSKEKVYGFKSWIAPISVIVLCILITFHNGLREENITKTAIGANLVEVSANIEEWKGKEVWIEGRIETILKPNPLGEFTVNTGEGDGSQLWQLTLCIEDYSLGEDVKIYGRVGSIDTKTQNILIVPVVTERKSCTNKEDTDINSLNEDIFAGDKDKEENEESENIREKAVKADFVKINGHIDEWDGKLVWLEGEITVVMKPGKFGEYVFATDEGDGWGVWDLIECLEEYEEGDKLKIYGMIYGINEDTKATRIVPIVTERQ